MTTWRRCKHLDVKPNAAGKVVPLSANSYRCTVEAPRPPMPNCMLKVRNPWPPSRSYMSPYEGTGCPFFEARS